MDLDVKIDELENRIQALEFQNEALLRRIAMLENHPVSNLQPIVHESGLISWHTK